MKKSELLKKIIKEEIEKLIEKDSPERIKLDKEFDALLGKAIEGYKGDLTDFYEKFEAVKSAHFDEGFNAGSLSGQNKPFQRTDDKNKK